MDIENTDNSVEEESLEVQKETKPPKSNTIKVGKRTAFVYTGAAILIVVVGLRTLLQMADEGFGMVEYFTIGALVVEFSVLLLYAFTIYSVSKDDARKEGFAVQSKDMPAVAMQLQILSESVTAEIQQMQSQNDRLHALYDKDIPALSEGLAGLAAEFKAAFEQIQEHQTGAQAQTNSLFTELSALLKPSAIGGGEDSNNKMSQKLLDQLASTEESTKVANEKLLDQLTKNESVMRENMEQTSALAVGIKEVIEEQVTLRIRQEIQHILSAPIVKQGK